MGGNQLREVGQLARKGELNQARELAQEIATREPENAQAWLWLSYVTPSDNEKRAALRRALALRPGDHAIRDALRNLITPPHIQRAARSGVFVSYARADELFAITLSDSLRAIGIDAWIDMAEINIETTWHSSVARALIRSGLMLLILSPEALQSDELRSERAWFLETGKVIVPALHKTCDYKMLNLLCPPVDFRDDFSAGLNNLTQLLHGDHQAGHPA